MNGKVESRGEDEKTLEPLPHGRDGVPRAAKRMIAAESVGDFISDSGEDGFVISSVETLEVLSCEAADYEVIHGKRVWLQQFVLRGRSWIIGRRRDRDSALR